MPYQSRDYQLAAALAAALQAALPAETVTVVGDPRLKREGMTEFEIRVQPATLRQPQQKTRAWNVDERSVWICVVGPCDPTDLDQLDRALAKCETVRALWGAGGALRSAAAAGHTPIGEVTQDPLWDERLLLRSQIFLAPIEVRYLAPA